MAAGWALCGHEAAPGACTEAGTEGAEGEPAEAAMPATTAATAAGSSEPSPASASGEHRGASSTHEPQTGIVAATSGVAAADRQGPRKQGSAAAGQWHPADTLNHQQRISLGMKCKQLIDAGRCEWLQQQLCAAMREQQQVCLGVTAVAAMSTSNTSSSSAALHGRGCDGSDSVITNSSGNGNGSSSSTSSGSWPHVQRVTYIDESVSGENTLLLVGHML